MDTLFDGSCIQCQTYSEDGLTFANIVFNNKTASVNKFDEKTLKELSDAVAAVEAKKTNLKGLLITSAKDVFIVGADIMEFRPRFAATEEELTQWLGETHKIFNRIEDLPFASVACVNGVCLGGGMELALAATYRIAGPTAKLGLPEVKLGIYPGWGGTIRLPRLVGADNAIEWIASGNQFSAKDAHKIGAVDGVTETTEALLSAGKALLKSCAREEMPWQQKREEKIQPLTLKTPVEYAMVFEGAKGFIAGQAGPNYPAPLEAVKSMQLTAGLKRDESMAFEIKGFVKMAKTSTADALVNVFVSDQFNKKKTGQVAKKATSEVKQAAVIGAGIMGGGIAYQSAVSGIPIFMKDIQPKALELGLTEAAKILGKLNERGKMNTMDVAKVMGIIMPTLSFGDFGFVDVVVEAVVENETVKAKVLAEVEAAVRPGCVLTSNTSTISINKLAQSLKRPEDFCGMHFFNPVHKMPLVEIIRGEKTSETTVAKVVAFALKMGKTPIIVNDCPGFLVNRVLFPYLAGLTELIQDGVNLPRIDKIMEKFGWPMGPAYLLDVIGLDTGMHAESVMAKGFPDRLGLQSDLSPIGQMVKANRLGQKNGKGFYLYQQDEKGRSKKVVDPEVEVLFKSRVKAVKEVSDEDIVTRMMVPMVNEAARCLEEKIAETAMEVDLAMLYGIGFPPFRGGVLKYADSVGLKSFEAMANKFSYLGKRYEPVNLVKELAKSNKTFYSL